MQEVQIQEIISSVLLTPTKMFELQVDGDIQLARNLSLLDNRIADVKGFFNDALQLVEKRTDSIFKKNGQNVQKAPKWKKPLADSTNLARKNRWGYYKKPKEKGGMMRWTGNLQKNRTKTVTNKEGVLKFNAPYAIYHQEGGKNLPQRVIVDIDNPTIAEINRTLQKKIEKEIGIYGLQT